MRIVVYGVGAVGGTLAAGLVQAGIETVGIARGRQLAALQAGPLVLETPDTRLEARVPCFADPTEIGLRPDDMILMTVKTQDAPLAFDRLAAAGLADQPVFCAQNGLANEDLASRHTPNVHGVAVMMPSTMPEPGRVRSYVHPRFGLFDVGRYPFGSDEADHAFAEAMIAANCACDVTNDVMYWKRGKLIVNLSNVIDAAVGGDVDFHEIANLAKHEAEDVYRAAGLEWGNIGPDSPRRKVIQFGAIGGEERSGSSTAQSLLRGASQLETPYLNGEIVRIARQSGGDAPVNAALVRLGAHLAGNREAPGTMSLQELRDRIGL